jgi:hypothetical protein
LPVALETEAGFQFIGHELKVGRLLQRQKLLEEADGCRRPIRPMVATGELGGEPGTFLEEAGAKPVKVGTADLKVLGGINGVNATLVELLKYLLKKQVVQPAGDLLFL